ncbi:MAG: hypothetical protein H0X30_22960 [Anaerolineae bacterium]|nr:hypothetical protein [Anaerolineae bacterium]
MINQQDVPAEIRSKKFEIPRGYYRIHELGLTNIQPWYFLDGQVSGALYKGIQMRYPQRVLLPFARRQDNDDVTCFVVDSGDYTRGQVLIIHDYASPGYEVDDSFPSFWDWFRMAINEMIDNSEALSDK